MQQECRTGATPAILTNTKNFLFQGVEKKVKNFSEILSYIYSLFVLISLKFVIFWYMIFFLLIDWYRNIDPKNLNYHIEFWKMLSPITINPHLTCKNTTHCTSWKGASSSEFKLTSCGRRENTDTRPARPGCGTPPNTPHTSAAEAGWEGRHTRLQEKRQAALQMMFHKWY